MIKNEQKIMFDEWLFLYNNYAKFEPIEQVCYPFISKNMNIIGENVKINHNYYREDFFNTSKDKRIHILMRDGSMIFFQYLFDKNGKILEHHLTFYPIPKEDDTIDLTLSKMIRIDFEETGYKPCSHSLVHLHNGKFSSFRFALGNMVSPLEFLSFIMIHLYNYTSQEIISKLKEMRETVKDDESGTFFMKMRKK